MRKNEGNDRQGGTKVIDLGEYRKEKGIPTEAKMAARDKLIDGQHSIFRGNLYVHIDDTGNVDYSIVRAERVDAPALVLACLIMCMELTQMIDREAVL